MSTAAQPSSSDPRIRTVEITEERITAYLVDGRTISVPLAWSWRLAGANQAERARYEIIGDGTGIRWPAVDEDLSVRGMLEGRPSHR